MMDMRSGRHGQPRDPTPEGDRMLMNTYLDHDKHQDGQCSCTPTARCRSFHRLTEHVIKAHSEAITRRMLDWMFQESFLPPQQVVKEANEEGLFRDNEAPIKEEQLKEEHHPTSGGGGIEDGLPGEDPDNHVLLRMAAKLQSDQVSLLKLRQQDEGLIQLLVQEKAEAVQLADSIMTTAENVKAKRELAHAAELALVREEAGLMSSPLAAQSDTAEELQEPAEEEEVLEVVRPGGSQCSAGWRGVKRSGVPLPVPSPHKKGKVASQEVVADYPVGEAEETAAEVSKDSVAWLHTLFGRNRKIT